MAENFELASLGDPLHFSSPLRWQPDWNEELVLPRLADAAEWESRDLDVWRAYRPVGAAMPSQGWKLHLSATQDSVRTVLDAVADIALQHSVPFKHLRSRTLLAAMNSRTVHRSSASKAVAMYPAGPEQLELVADALASRLQGVPGPYVLSDRQWTPGTPVYLRYGAFVPAQTYSADGRLVPALRRDGRLVEDERTVPFRVPAGVPVPAVLAERVRPVAPPADLPVRLTGAVQHSACGGVYRGTQCRTGASVIVKEARPLVGGNPHLPDAIDRLRREAEALAALEGTATPRLVETFEVDGHLFVAAEEVPGTTLRHWVAEHHPRLHPEPSQEEHDAYARACATIGDRLEAAVRELHDRGWAHNDIHPGNILVDDELRVRLVDLELAGPCSSSEQPGLACAGFALGSGTGVERDLLGVTMVRAWLLHPAISGGVELVPTVLDSFAQATRRWFGAAGTAVDEAARAYAQRGRNADVERRTGHRVNVLSAPPAPHELMDYLTTVATPQEPVLFPGHASVFSDPLAALAIEHGCCGVLLAVLETGAEVPPAWREHLLTAFRQLDRSAGSPGLWDGWAGVALTLAVLGETDAARSALLTARSLAAGCTAPSLRSGRAGITLALLLLSDLLQDPDLEEQAVELMAPLAGDPTTWTGRCRERGLAEGPSGVATVLTTLARRQGKADLAVVAEAWLDQDLQHCVASPHQTLELVSHGVRLPYLGQGSLGVALAREAVHQALGEEVDDVDLQLLRAGCIDLTVEPGLLHGAVGLAFVLEDAARSRPAEDARPLLVAAERQLETLTLLGARVGNGASCLGRGSVRLSADLMTGAAGVLAVLSARQSPTNLLRVLLGVSDVLPQRITAATGHYAPPSPSGPAPDLVRGAQRTARAMSRHT